MTYCANCEAGLTSSDYEAGFCTQCRKEIRMRYRILRPSDLIRYGDERWDFEFGWTKVEDPQMERFSKEYRRADIRIKRGARHWRKQVFR